MKSKNLIRHTCGHEEITWNDDDSTEIDKLAALPCLTCLVALQNDMEQYEERMQLPALNGSYRQVQWARVIRYRMMKKYGGDMICAIMSKAAYCPVATFWIEDVGTSFDMENIERCAAVRAMPYMTYSDMKDYQ